MVVLVVLVGKNRTVLRRTHLKVHLVGLFLSGEPSVSICVIFIRVTRRLIRRDHNRLL